MVLLFREGLWRRGLHDALKDDDLVVVCGAGGQGRGLVVGVRGHVLQMVGPPHRRGQVCPTLRDKTFNRH